MKTAYSLCLYFCIALSGLASTGWDTNVWGNVTTNGVTETIGTNIIHRYYLDASTNKVFIKNIVYSNSFDALDERASAVGVSGPSRGSGWFRFSRTRLVSAKSWVVSHASKFILADAPSPAISTDTGNYSNNLNTCYSGTVSKDQDHGLVISYNNFTNISTSFLIDTLSIPSNYFTSTPWRKLTDPATSNGWHFMDDICNLLTLTQEDGSWYSGTETNHLTANDLVSLVAWTTTVSSANANLQYFQSATASPKKSGTAIQFARSGFPCSYDLNQETIYNYPVFGTSSTNEYEVKIYAHFIEEELVLFQSTNRYSDGFIKYDSDGLSGIPTNSSLALVQSYTNISGIVTSLVAVGDTALGTPVDTIEPDESNNSIGFIHPNPSRNDWINYESLGWVVNGNPLSVLNYASTNLTNGFTFTSN